MQKLDLRKTLKSLYSAKQKAAAITVPKMNYIKIDGQGDPNISKTFAKAAEALYAASYCLKFKVKKQGGEIDYRVMPLEGLWWADDMDEFSTDRKNEWKWTIMILQPDFITNEMYDQAIEEVKTQKGLVALDSLRFEEYDEGPCAQILHVGPFSEEKPTIDKLHKFIDDKKKKRKGLHHEIYLNDFRRTAPENLKTIIRQPLI